MRVEVFGYYLYPLFFVYLFGIPLAITAAIILFKRFRASKAVYSINVITDWQKDNIPFILRKQVGVFTKTELVNDICDYIQYNEYWNDDEMLEIDESIVMDSVKALLNEVYEVFISDPNKAVLILNTIDTMNGGLDLSSGRITEWMDDALPGQGTDYGMTDSDAKLFVLMVSTVVRANDLYTRSGIDKIPAITDAIEELVGLSITQLDMVAERIEEASNFEDISDRDLYICKCCLMDHVLNLFKKYNDITINDYYLSYIRALACVLDKQSYPDIVSTIV